MRAARLVFLFVAAAMLLSLVPALADRVVAEEPFGGPAFVVITKDYPISLKYVDDVSKLAKREVVVVNFINQNGNAVGERLNDFMEVVVPQFLLATGDLPAPAGVATANTHVTIPNYGKIAFENQAATPYGFIAKDRRPVLPLYLRVKARTAPIGANNVITQDRNERFKGIIGDPWGIESYFVTKYTATARVTKEHKVIKYPAMKACKATGSLNKFNWVDP